MSLKQIIKRFNEINLLDGTKLLQRKFGRTYNDLKTNYWNGIITYKPYITKPINHWFPEMSFTKSASGNSVNDQFFDETVFYQNSFRLIKQDVFKFSIHCPNKKTSKFLIDGLRLTLGNQPVQNFPVGVAKLLYLEYAEKYLDSQTDFYILDPCFGWGSRLVAAMAICNKLNKKNIKVHYFGTDVHSAIYGRYSMLISFWKEHINPDMNFGFYQPPSILPYEDVLEDNIFQSMRGKFHLALTSPPYFGTEQYSDDHQQSYKRYPFYEGNDKTSWKNNFLKKFMLNTHDLLSENGFLYLNIADAPARNKSFANGKIPLIDDSINLALEAGFTYKKRYGIEMPSHSNFSKELSKSSNNIQRRNDKKHKYEPVLVFVK